jgi:heat shock protein HslJ
MRGARFGWGVGVLLSAAAAAAEPPGGAWLDAAEPPAWNRPGARVPQAPRVAPDAVLAKQCAPQVRKPSTPGDRAVAAAGWQLVGASQRFGDTEVVTGQSSVDGMCRPLGYQVFAFQGGKFAGTLSPHPMDARTDGSAQVPSLFSADGVAIVFSRYGPEDALCCPSRLSSVQYRIERRKEGPVVVATAVGTAPTAAASPPPGPAPAGMCTPAPVPAPCEIPATAGAPTSSIALRTWQLVRIRMADGTALGTDHPAKYTLELQGDGRAMVRADCNRGSGTYRMEGRSLSFGPLATTRAACSPGSLSDRWLQQLGLVATYTERDGGLLLATRGDGAVLELQPAPGQDGVMSGSERCTRSGGTVEQGSCCGLVGDFPNTCLLGACGCAPEHSHPVQVCRCPAGRCFDGKSCVPAGGPPGGQLR